MKEFFARPGFLGTYGTVGADLTFLSATAFTILFLVAWYAARKHQGNRHHVTILWAVTTMIVYFSSYYVTRGLGVLAIDGKEGFGGPDWFYVYIFSPVLTIHILLVSVGLMAAVYMIILGFRATLKESGHRFLKTSDLKVKNKNFYIALTAILAAMCLFAFLRCETLRCASVYGAGLALVIVAFSFEKLMEKVSPQAGHRHKVVGKFTMVVFVGILVTSAFTYVSLYVLYEPLLLL